MHRSHQRTGQSLRQHPADNSFRQAHRSRGTQQSVPDAVATARTAKLQQTPARCPWAQAAERETHIPTKGDTDRC